MRASDPDGVHLALRSTLWTGLCSPCVCAGDTCFVASMWNQKCGTKNWFCWGNPAAANTLGLTAPAPHHTAVTQDSSSGVWFPLALPLFCRYLHRALQTGAGAASQHSSFTIGLEGLTPSQHMQAMILVMSVEVSGYQAMVSSNGSWTCTSNLGPARNALLRRSATHTYHLLALNGSSGLELGSAFVFHRNPLSRN